MEGIWQDLRTSVRWLFRRPAFTLAVTVTLALAVGANTVMFGVVDAVLLRPLPYPESDELVTLWEASRETKDVRRLVSRPNFEDWRRGSRAFESMATYRDATATLTGLERAEVVRIGRVSDGFFDVFETRPIHGRGIRREETLPGGPRAAVVSHDFWRQRLGGDDSAVGRTLEIEGRDYEIVGVAPEGFDFPEGARIWIGDRVDVETCGRGCVTLQTVGRLSEGTSLSQAREEFDLISRGLERAYPDANHDLWVNLVPLRDLVVGDVRQGLLILLGAVAMVLLIACANVAHLLFASALGRRGEIAVRAALGATRGRLVRQLLTESGVLSVLGGLVGVLLAVFGVRALDALGPVGIPRLEGLAVDGSVLTFALIVMLDATLIFGLAPAISLARTSVSSRMNPSGRGSTTGRGRGWGKSGLLVSQVALSTILLLGTGLLLRSLVELRSVDPGFDPEAVETFTVVLPSSRYPEPADAIRFHAELTQRIEAIPGVESAGAAMGSPLSGWNFGSGVRLLDRPEPPPGEGVSALVRIVTPGYLETLGIQIVRGRRFDGRDRTGAPGVVLASREAAERFWPGDDPIGKRLQLSATQGLPERERTVVGIVEDVRSLGLARDPRPELYIPHAQSGAPALNYVVRRADSAPPVLPGIRDVLARLDPDLGLRSPGMLADALGRELSRPSFYLTVLGVFAAMALILAAVGLYGVVAHQVSRRYREIGIRVAIGAEAGDVVRMIAHQGLAPALVGLAIGLVAGYGVSRIVEGILYNVAPVDPLAWGAVVVALLAVVVLASVVPARRASSIPPAEALRVE